jgi:uncharacterized membrane protein YkoI
MMKKIFKLLDLKRAGFAALFAVMSLSLSDAAHAACYSGGEARSIVASNGLTKIGTIAANFRRDGAEVTHAQLCTKGSGYEYRLTILTSQGQVKRVNVNAKAGY